MRNDERLVKLLTQGNFHRPICSSRKQEYGMVKKYAAAYGIEIDEIDFDNAYADYYGDGCELEWPKE